MQKKMVTLILVGILLLNFAVFLVNADQRRGGDPPADAMWIEPYNVSFTAPPASVGQTFNITVWLNLTEDVYAYQIGLLYNRTLLKCTRCGFTAGVTSSYFAGHTTTPAGPLIDGSALGNGSVAVGESLVGATDFVPGPKGASLVWMEFQILVIPSAGSFSSRFDIITTYPSDTYVLDPDLNTIGMTPYDGDYLIVRVTPSSPDAMWIEPYNVSFTAPPASVGQTFNITVWLNMTEDIYDFQIGLLYNRTLLKCTRAGFTAGATSDYFANHTTILGGPVIDTGSLGNGSLMVGETVMGSDFIPGPRSASLIWAEFQILIVPSSGSFYDKFDITTTYPSDTYLLDPNLNLLSMIPYDADYVISALHGPGPLLASISPSSASIFVNQSLLFTSNVSGGTSPYLLQWYLNGAPIPGETSSSYVFSSSVNGTFTVYLGVTDSIGASARSNVSLVIVAFPAGVEITPSVIEGTVYPGQTEHDSITVKLPPSTPKGDVVFIFDTTGSMSWIIANMQTKALAIMGNISALIPDTAFGVGSFCDYPHSYNSYGYAATYGSSGTDYAFKMDQDMTTNQTAISKAINSIVYGNGYDVPEDYTRAIWESLHYSWRPGAKKIVVLFGDAPPHSAPSGLNLTKPWNPSELLFSSAYGGDPGPDETMFTADDLDYGPVVKQVADNHITFICVDCQSSSGYGYNDDAHNNFNYVAYMTGGVVFPYSSGTIADDIIAKIKGTASQPISVLTLQPDAPYASWVSWSPTSYFNVSWGRSVSFSIDITPPAGTLPGNYTFGISVVGDGVTLGTVKVIKHVPSRTFTLTVHVIDSISNQSISGVTVIAAGPEYRSGVTDGGTVVFNSTQPGNYNVTAYKLGYTSASVNLNLINDTEITLRLTPLTRELKKDAIAELKAAENLTKSKQTLHKIDAAIEEIKESLDPCLWVDDFHLDPKHGHKVFQEEKNAVGNLMYILKDKKEGAPLKNVVQTVIGKLVWVDQLLADAAIKDAKASRSTDRRACHEIKEAEEEFSEALRQIAKGNYDNAIEEFKDAWMRAEHAMRKCFGDVDADGMVGIKDIATVAKCFGSNSGRSGWNPLADLNGDDKVDIKDLATAAANYGNSYID